MIERRRVARRAATAKEGHTIGLERRLAHEMLAVVRETTSGHDVEQPRGTIFGPTRPAGGKDRGPADEDLGVYEEVGKGGV